MDSKNARIITGDVLGFARHYKGEKFHALICDAPYHLTTITNRFGKEGSAPAQYGKDGAFQRVSKGFRSQAWDGGDIAFRPETWRAFWDLLHPGAFGMTFGGSRTAHRMAVAIEDAGYIIHPMMGWVYGSGFPKATRIDTQIDAAAGAERAETGFAPNTKGRLSEVHVESQSLGKSWSGKQSLPATDLGQTWEGHRYGLQALKPALEPIIVFQKPYEGRRVDDITRTGAGALNIDGGRIGLSGIEDHSTPGRGQGHGSKIYQYKDDKEPNPVQVTRSENKENPRYDNKGRWPANFIIQHSPSCKRVGTTPDGYTINRFTDGAKPFGDAVGEEYEGEEVGGESVVWECSANCPARELNRQSGHLKSGLMTPEHNAKNWGWHKGERKSPTLQDTYNDSGGASRFFFNADYAYENLENAAPFVYQAKAGKKERNAGLSGFDKRYNDFQRENSFLSRAHGDKDGSKGTRSNPNQNPHPTIKPISLIKHLATLLLPPEAYAPRRIFNPFAGTGSEILGCIFAGWDVIVGVEKENEYIKIGRARIDWWSKANRRNPALTPHAILKTYGNADKETLNSQIRLPFDNPD